MSRKSGIEATEEPGGRSTRRQWIERLAVALLVAAIWLPRGLALDRFVTIDEVKWVMRSGSFLAALAQGDLAKTYQREHPGVTTMWAGSAGIVWRYLTGQDAEAGRDSLVEYSRVIELHGEGRLDILAAGRAFMALAGTVALALGLFYARRMLGLVPALVGFVLIAFDPFHLAFSRFLHLDGLLSSLLLLAVLAFVTFLHTRRPVDLVVSGVAAGLSWLTKSPGVFVVPVVVLLAAIELWMNRSARRGDRVAAQVWEFVWPLLVWGLVAVIVFVLLWPAMWVDPVGTLRQLGSVALTYAERGHESATFFNGQVYTDGRISTPWFYPVTYLWRSTPVILAGLLMAVAALLLRREPLNLSKARRTVVGLALFVVVFTLLQNVGLKKFDRYLVPVYPPLDLIAATGWVAAAAWLRERPSLILQRYGAPVVLGGVLLFQAVGTLQTSPYYISYYNPAMGGAKRAPEVMQIGWGEGLDQAARYLNERIGERPVQVAAWYTPCFEPFFSARTQRIAMSLEEIPLEEVLASDYVVSYIHQWQRGVPKDLVEYLSELTPIRSIWIDGIEYARIYRVKRLPPVPEPSQLVAEGNLGDRARLVGFDPPPPLEAAPGTTLPITLTWESLGTFDDDYTVFVHVAGADRRPIAQADSQPWGGAYPTTLWDVGDRLADPYLLTLPPDAPPGVYELMVGMYLLSTGERLPVLGAEGQVLGDSISLGQLTVSQPGE